MPRGCCESQHISQHFTTLKRFRAVCARNIRTPNPNMDLISHHEKHNYNISKLMYRWNNTQCVVTAHWRKKCSRGGVISHIRVLSLQSTICWRGHACMVFELHSCIQNNIKSVRKTCSFPTKLASRKLEAT